jgi:SAM-dependent methyltransferase
MNHSDKYRGFYDQHHVLGGYSTTTKGEEHAEFGPLSHFLDKYSLRSKRCLEIGCGRGAFKMLVQDYTGVDVSPWLGRFYPLPKRFVCASATNLPLPDDQFDVIWSIYSLEHVVDLPAAIAEMRRVLKPGGFMFLRPAWSVPFWASTGVSVRPFAQLSFRLKLIKLLLPVMNCRFVKGPLRIFRRLLYVFALGFPSKPERLYYGRLKPDLETFWTSDSDAINSIDLFMLSNYFRARGDEILQPASSLRCLIGFSQPLIIRKRRDE